MTKPTDLPPPPAFAARAGTFYYLPVISGIWIFVAEDGVFVHDTEYGWKAAEKSGVLYSVAAS